jgi:hypothetical protein
MLLGVTDEIHLSQVSFLLTWWTKKWLRPAKTKFFRYQLEVRVPESAIQSGWANKEIKNKICMEFWVKKSLAFVLIPIQPIWILLQKARIRNIFIWSGEWGEGIYLPDDPCLKRIVKHVGIFAAIHIHQVPHVGVGPRFLNKCTLWGNVPDPIYGATPGYSDQFSRIFNSEIRKSLISYCRFSECVFFTVSLSGNLFKGKYVDMPLIWLWI